MEKKKKDIKLHLPHFLLIAGNGRNVGKTYFACSIIRKLTSTENVAGLKISAHFHPYDKEHVIAEDKNFIIIEEKQYKTKDSSLMLQAGAQKVYFIMVAPNHLREAFQTLLPYLSQRAVVCESGGLHEQIQPGLFFFVKQTNTEISKEQHLKYNPIIVNNDGKNLDFDLNRVYFSNNQFMLKQ